MEFGIKRAFNKCGPLVSFSLKNFNRVENYFIPIKNYEEPEGVTYFQLDHILRWYSTVQWYSWTQKRGSKRSWDLLQYETVITSTGPRVKQNWVRVALMT